mmetsp:Transcript_6368/g.13284  ORF Transcript_6368/g.13284 Transcript_6368/m.13284 type:complete len:81 (+) Transcript_6368:431-673(+)
MTHVPPCDWSPVATHRRQGAEMTRSLLSPDVLSLLCDWEAEMERTGPKRSEIGNDTPLLLRWMDGDATARENRDHRSLRR